MPNTPIDDYLRKSTRGLWGRKRAEVTEELSTHINGRVHSHLIAGLSERDAVAKALAELGQPRAVSAGMARVYTLPIMAGSGMVFAMCCALVVVLLTSSTAQTLSVSNIFPANECINEGTISLYCKGNEWVSIEKLKETLEPQGVTFKTRVNNWVLTFPDNKVVELDTHTQQWSFYFDNKDPVTLNSQPGHLTVRSFLKSLMAAGVKVRLQGWEKPIAYLGDNVSLKLDLANPTFEYGGFYAESLAGDIFNELHFPTTYWTTASAQEITTELKTFKVNDEMDAVYGIIAIVDSNKIATITEDVNDTSVMYWNIDHVDDSKEVQLRLPLNQTFTFKENLYKVKAIGDALLVRLSGEQDYPGYVVIPPDQFTLE
jgi:hypothetical protein